MGDGNRKLARIPQGAQDPPLGDCEGCQRKGASEKPRVHPRWASSSATTARSLSTGIRNIGTTLTARHTPGNVLQEKKDPTAPQCPWSANCCAFCADRDRRVTCGGGANHLHLTFSDSSLLNSQHQQLSPSWVATVAAAPFGPRVQQSAGGTGERRTQQAVL